MTVNETDVNEAFDDYVDTLGEYLEHQGFSDDEIDEYFLAHYGKKGMKWGVRRGKGTTGESRVRGAVLDRNQRSMQRQLRRRSGVGTISDRATQRVLTAAVGERRARVYRDLRITAIQNQRGRIKAGETNVLDKLQTLALVPVGGLFVTATAGNAGRRTVAVDSSAPRTTHIRDTAEFRRVNQAIADQANR